MAALLPSSCRIDSSGTCVTVWVMVGDSVPRVVYHISPWRRHVAWLIFGPLIVVFLGIALLVPEGKPGDQAALLLAPGIFALVAIFISLLTRTARLELSQEGVRLHQLGYVLESTWSNVTALRLVRGREGLVTAEPMTGKGVQRLGSMAGTSFRGVPLYDAGQQTLLAEHRFIPIEAFAWHLRKGRSLREDIFRFAPHLQEDFDAPAPQPDQLRGRDLWKAIGITVALIIPAVALALSPQAFQDRVLGYVWPVVAPLLTLRAAVSAWSSIRAKCWWLGIFFVLLTIVLFLWTIGEWFGGKAR